MDTNFHEFISLPGKRHSCRFSETFFKEISFGGISASDRKVASPKTFPRTARLGGEDVHVFVAGTRGRRAAEFRPSGAARRGNEDRNVFAPKKRLFSGEAPQRSTAF